ncbi:hypothetical protein P5V15_005903 [Pogonomyrmex californicus]
MKKIKKLCTSNLKNSECSADLVEDNNDNSEKTSIMTDQENKDETDNEGAQIKEDNSNNDLGIPGNEKLSIPRRSNCTPKSKKWLDYLTFKISLETTEKEPSSLEEAIIGSHSKQWSLAMKELEALTQNKTWEICSPPKNKKILKPKWVYKIK